MSNDVKVNQPPLGTPPAGSLDTTPAVEKASPPVVEHPPGWGVAGNRMNPADCRECLAAMAHRLSQPMTALRGGIELGLLGKRSVADYRSLLEQSLQLADGMAQLIVSLRDLGESGAPAGDSQCVLLEAAVSRPWQGWRGWRNPVNSACNSRLWEQRRFV